MADLNTLYHTLKIGYDIFKDPKIPNAVKNYNMTLVAHLSKNEQELLKTRLQEYTKLPVLITDMGKQHFRFEIFTEE